MNRILIATDGSAASEAAVRDGITLALETGGVVRFIAVWHTHFGGPTVHEGPTAEEARLGGALADAMHTARAAGIEASDELAQGSPVDEIIRAADAFDADLVVVGSRGRGALKASVLGSVSRRVVTRSRRPVLVVHDRDAVVHEVRRAAAPAGY
jgi:nucleotide-binding universal stress UspA family protein